MGTGRKSAWGACLLVALLAASGPSRAVDLQAGAPSPDEQAAPNPELGSLGKTALSADDLRDQDRQTPSERLPRLNAVLAAHPDDLAALFFRTQAEIELPDDAAAISDSALILARPELSLQLRQVVLQWRAEALLGERRFDEAIATADQILALDSSNADAMFTRGWARFIGDKRQADDALSDFDRALALSPDEGIGYMRRGSVYLEQGKFDRASKDFERAVQLTPGDAPSHRKYGELLYRTHDLVAALAQLDAAERLAPDDPFTVTWKAQANFALKRFDEAVAEDRRADQLGAAGKDLRHALGNVVVALDAQQDFVGEARVAAHLLALGDNPDAAADLTRSLWFSGQFGQAAAAFRRHGAAPVSGDYAQLWLYIVRGRADLNDEPAAKLDLAAHAPAHEPHAWADTLVDLMLGEKTLEAALAEADSATTIQLRAGRRCEADYYAAEQLLMRDQVALASGLLEEAYWACPFTYVEAHAVTAERHLLEARSRPQ